MTAIKLDIMENKETLNWPILKGMVKRAFKSELLLSMIEDVTKFMTPCYNLDTINKETADKMKGNITEV